MFGKILVANRGEVAVRIIRTCQHLGVGTIAIYSDVDKDALHTRLADESVRVGASSPADSYLNIERIIEIAVKSGVEAIHPGYGFRSEHWDFAAACESIGVEFIGPSSRTLSMTGNKVDCKNVVRHAGVPTIPGTDYTIDDVEEGERAARELGYPVMLKSAFGGGGRGIREAKNEEDLRESFRRAEREAKGAFGKSGVYIEKVIRPARHIEFQVLADGKGRIVHLGERECSVQRKHQKLIELTPSPVVDEETRKRVEDFATVVARTVGYKNIGTVEFLRNDAGDFYFIEMNARLQVEHPVTEMVTGIDLVEEQLRIASGEGIGFSQEMARPQGAAIQCRINAEDPALGFVASTGLIDRVSFPGGPNVRIDSALYRGSEVSQYYDPLLAKVIAWGRNLEEARRRVLSALSEFHVEGVRTNVAFQRYLLEHERFTKWELATDLLTRERMIESFAEASKRQRAAALEESAAVAAAILAHGFHRTVTFKDDTASKGPRYDNVSGGARYYDAV